MFLKNLFDINDVYLTATINVKKQNYVKSNLESYFFIYLFAFHFYYQKVIMFKETQRSILIKQINSLLSKNKILIYMF